MKVKLLKNYRIYRKGDTIELNPAFVDILVTNGYIEPIAEKKIPAKETELKADKSDNV